jgi:hypothetical protein
VFALILMLSSLTLAQEASSPCANLAAAQSEAAEGPDGTTVVLRVSSTDDASKNSHQCNANYDLKISRPGGGEPQTGELLTSNDDYGRQLSGRLSGFSRDGKHVLGILRESGKHGIMFAFDYQLRDGAVQLIDLKEKIAGMANGNCGETAAIGTTANGGIVVEVTAGVKGGKPCAASGRWMVDGSGRKAQRLRADAAVAPLRRPNRTQHKPTGKNALNGP